MDLLEGDVLVQLRTLPDKHFKCIVTSPPYNLGMKYGDAVDDRKPYDVYLAWIRDVFLECKRVLTDDGSLFLNVGYTSREPWIAMDVANALRKDYVLQNQFTWVKNISIGEISHGHFKPINSKRFVTVTNESVFHFTKTGEVDLSRLSIGVPFMHKSNLHSRSKAKKDEVKPDCRCRGNTWYVPYETIQSNKKERGGHPASYPVQLADYCIKLCMGDTKDGRVLDPFVGTGTTLVAARRLGLTGTGIDINPEFLAFTRSRLEALAQSPDTSSSA
jgi:site-specific DNA-methyltransferase (adenine-specific)